MCPKIDSEASRRRRDAEARRDRPRGQDLGGQRDDGRRSVGALAGAGPAHHRPSGADLYGHRRMAGDPPRTLNGLVPAKYNLLLTCSCRPVARTLASSVFLRREAPCQIHPG